LSIFTFLKIDTDENGAIASQQPDPTTPQLPVETNKIESLSREATPKAKEPEQTEDSGRRKRTRSQTASLVEPPSQKKIR
jgi:hypothetical protein